MADQSSGDYRWGVVLRPEGDGESSAVREVVDAVFDDVTVAR